MTTLISFVVLLLVLIFVHELGHFLAAKLLGVRVERFSLGFPPKAFSKTIGETEYQLAWLPLGGYVKMYGEDPEEAEAVDPALRRRSFSHKPPWAKIIIVLAGPVFNIIFAVFLLALLYFAAGNSHLAPIVGPLTSDSPAFQAGLRMDDHILAVDGRPIKYFEQVEEAVENSGGRPLSLEVLRQGQNFVFEARPAMTTVKNLYEEDVAVQSLGLSVRIEPVIGRIIKGRPAEAAGLKAEDRIASIDGNTVTDWRDVLFALQGSPEGRLKDKDDEPSLHRFVVEREGRRLEIEVRPEMIPAQTVDGRTVYTPLVGMESKITTVHEDLNLVAAFSQGLTNTAWMIKEIFISIGKLFEGSVSIKTLGGPLQIAQITGQQAEAGWLPLLKLAAFISINLGILNLLPIPVLDGGQLVFFVVEAITRRPVSLRIRLAAQWVGICLLGLLMITVFYNDIVRFLVQLNVL